MVASSLPFVLGLVLSASALHIPLHQSRRGSLSKRSGGIKFSGKSQKSDLFAFNSKAPGDGLDLVTVNDLIYMANITVGGNDYPVQLDTGSSDLWIMGPTPPLPNVTHSPTTYNLTYGIGWAFGNISRGAVEFAGLSIPSQAFLDVSSATNPALSYGATGILGLGFTSLSSIDYAVNQTGADWGRSLLLNAFIADPTTPNYITFAMQRSTEAEDEIEGTFTIGEVISTYSAINNEPRIPTWPVSMPKRWNVLLDSFIVGTQTIGVSTNVSGAPSQKAVVLLDSGTSWTYVQPSVAEAIYGSIPGARLDTSLAQWVLPCSVEIDMAFQINGVIFPLHPLDVNLKAAYSPTGCVGSFVPQAVAVGAGEFDMLIGDNVLRSMYSMYDFGDFDPSGRMGDPYVKLLSLVDPNEASADFVKDRGGTARTNITYNVSDNDGGVANVSVSDKLADSLNKLVNYVPIILGLLGLNALALLVVAAVGVCYFVRRRKHKAKKNRAGGVALSARSPTPYPGSMIGANRSTTHEYERVAVQAENEPEDEPFTPPEPAFHGNDGDVLRPLPGTRINSMTRPRSMFSTLSASQSTNSLAIPRDYRVSAAGSDMTAFVPPSPPFHGDGFGGKGSRPKSIA